MHNALNVALVQHACGTDRAGNLQRSIAGIRRGAASGAHLIVLSELHTGPYFCQSEDPALFDLAEPIPGPTTATLAAVAGELRVVIVASLFERRAEGLFHNTAVVLDADGTIAGLYRKMHIPHDPGFYEKYYFTPGDLGFRPIDTSIGRLGVLVCWDQWFPEAARLMALAGADCLIYPTAIGWDPRDSDAERARQREAWITVQRGHAIANALPVLSCNRTGTERGPAGGQIDFWGSSFVAGPQGEILAEASVSSDAVLTTTLDRDRTRDLRRIWPFLRDRRCDAYGGLLQRYLDTPP